jgi:predicted ATPase/DNA-binding CsgD family transcriptional regulator
LNQLASKGTAIMGDERQEHDESLTARELEILRWIVAGLTNQQIADRLFVTLDTVKWHNQQSYQKLRVRSRTQAVARARELGLLEATAPQRSFRGKRNLPTQTTPFIAREEELAEIQHLLDDPGCRLLTLVGPGGIGKTRLALAAASQAHHVFSVGVCFVSLAAVNDMTLIVSAMAEALDFTFYGKADPEDQLLDWLCHKHLLFVVDNFEHLLDGATLLSAILSHAPEVRLIVTSRERLHLQEEWRYEVQGLLYPTLPRAEVASAARSEFEQARDRHEAEVYGAVQLFLHRARQADASFSPSAEEIADIVRICQLVEGMPLGLELAAPWIRSLTCHDIALEIERSLDFLTSSLRNLPARHRSLRVIIEQTWQRLLPKEQAVLRQLSIFRSGCTRQAAQIVTEATLSDLSSLIDKALLRRTDTGRYELHELIRQFAEEQLQADPDAIEHTRQRHTDFFITFLEQRTAGVKGARQRETLAEITADLDNVRLAWWYVIANRDAEAVERSAECLFIYYLYCNGYDEGCSEFGRAVTAMARVANMSAADGWPQELVISDQLEVLVGYLLAAHGYFLAHRRDLHAGQMLLEQALALLRRREARRRGSRQRAEAFTHLWLGWTFYFQGRTAEGQRCATKSLTLFAETADRWGEGWGLLLLGNCTKDGRAAEAELVYSRGLTICQESGDQNVLSYISFNLGNAATVLGHYAQAQIYIDHGLRIAEKQQNTLGLGYALFNRGQLEIAQGKYHQAIQTLEESIAYFNEIGTVHTSRAQVYLGIAFHLKGDHSQAKQLYARSLEGFQVADSSLGLARCLTSLGCLAHDQGNLHQSEQYHREALAIWQEMEMEAGIAVSLYHLGRLLLASGAPHDVVAIQYFRHALELAARHQLAPLALAVCVDVAKLRMKTGDTEQVIALLTLAEQHEAGTYETRASARQALAQKVNHTPPEAPQSTELKRQTGDLAAIVQGLLAEIW